MKIWNKKMTDLTVAETAKVSLVATLVSMLLAGVPFVIAAAVEGRSVPVDEVPDLEVNEEDEDEE